MGWKSNAEKDRLQIVPQGLSESEETGLCHADLALVWKGRQLSRGFDYTLAGCFLPIERVFHAGWDERTHQERVRRPHVVVSFS